MGLKFIPYNNITSHTYCQENVTPGLVVMRKGRLGTTCPVATSALAHPVRRVSGLFRNDRHKHTSRNVLKVGWPLVEHFPQV
jgi:hypothetical protein